MVSDPSWGGGVIQIGRKEGLRENKRTGATTTGRGIRWWWWFLCGVVIWRFWIFETEFVTLPLSGSEKEMRKLEEIFEANSDRGV